MSQDNQRPPQRAVLTVGTSLLMVAGAALGLMLMVIGAGVRSNGLVLAGIFIFPMAFIAGGVFSSDEVLAVRITLIAIGGLFVIAAASRGLLF